VTHLYKTYHIGSTSVSLTPNMSQRIRNMCSLNEDDVITNEHVKRYIDKFEPRTNVYIDKQIENAFQELTKHNHENHKPIIRNSKHNTREPA